MKRLLLSLQGLLVLLTLTSLFLSCSKTRSGNARILVFSKTMGYHHESIPNGIAAIQKLGSENNFVVDTTTNADWFNDDSLKKYAAIVFLSTTGDVLNSRQEPALERYIQSGGGYVGIHAAADCEYDWGWYGRMVGGYFLSHPGIHDTFPNVQDGVAHIVDANDPITKGLPNPWPRRDEFYSYKKINKDVHVLINIDEKSYHGGENGANHPMTWYHDYDGGRAFYTAFGHTKESFTEAPFLKLLLGGIQYAIGDNKELDYAKAKSQYPPDEDRFTKTELAEGMFFEPTEMTILPNYDILVLQRRGEIMLYKNDTKKVKQAGFFDVYYKTLHTPGTNAEEGMLGLAKDPNFSKNKWIYIYYSPSEVSVNRLSRFTFQNDTVDKRTEKIILEVKADREICCHTGGSIAFGPDGLLYFSAGDNSTPFDEKGAKYVSSGYAPLNDLPGHTNFDARRSAGNTNDLRGKIMRIRVKDDGTYEIPDGNLFPKGTANTRPEIYVMGNRNPYRISVDQKNSFLYWGEVGPDANNDSFATRGPRGYDEVNQARKAGFFGWPLFVGNNYPYHEYNYATGQSGLAFDPAHPINDSRNNTGLRDLPPAQPAFIWYPYTASPDFPQVGTGGRNAMAGPVYYTDMYPKSTRYPDYFNGKLFIYDWIRGWIKVVTMLPNGDFDKMESFMPSTKLHNVIDMEAGPDGKLYLLEYGEGWFAKNADAGISRIDYNGGNRPPAIASINVDKTSGLLPFAIKANVQAKDPDKDNVTYTWNFGNGATKQTNTPDVDYTYTKPGDYKVFVVAKDNHGASSTSDSVDVYAGNEAPQVSINLTGGNKSFYLPGMPIKYDVRVKDNDTAKVDPANFYVSVDYTQTTGEAAALGHQQGAAMASGKILMLSLDCKSCHKEAEKSIGPAFVQVSQKYEKKPDAANYLIQKIQKGGSGVWGDVAMPAHPNLSTTDAQQIVSWVLSLANPATAKKSLPPSGTIVPPIKAAKGPAGIGNQTPPQTLVLTASYTDRGGPNTKSLTGSNSVYLRSNMVSFTGREKVSGFNAFAFNGRHIMVFPPKEGWFAMDSIDLTGVRSVTIISGWQTPPKVGFSFEVHLDSPTGKLLGSGTMPTPQKKQPFGVAQVPLSETTDGQFHTLYFIYKGQEPIQGGVASVQFNGK